MLGDFLLKNIIPEYEKSKRKKIRIRIFYYGWYIWNTVQSFCEECENDVDVDLLLLTDYEDTERRLKEMQYKYINLSDYDAKKDCPDIFIIIHAYDYDHVIDIRDYCKFVVVIMHPLIRYEGSNDNFRIQMEKGYGRFSPDYYLFDSYLYKMFNVGEYSSDKYVEIGNPKYDGIYLAGIKREEYFEGKLNDRKTILWATDHGMYMEDEQVCIGDGISFDKYAKFIFNYFASHKEMGLIIRMHPAFYEELKTYVGWTDEDFGLLRSYCSTSDNIVLDENDDYNAAYAVADAIMTDCHTGILASALPTLKPICVLYRSSEIKDWEPELVQNYYKACNEEDLEIFFKMIEVDEDPKFELRKIASAKYVKHFDGKNGKRVKNFMKKIMMSSNSSSL